MTLKAAEGITICEMNNEKSLISVEGLKFWGLVKQIFNMEVETLALRYAEEIEYKDEIVEVLRIGRSSEYGYMLISTYIFSICETLVLGYEDGVIRRRS